MENLKQGLKIKLQHARKIAVLGIGSELRADDAAGILAARYIKEGLQKQSQVKVVIGGVSPENTTAEIKKFKPSHIIIFDSAELGKKPGSARVLVPEDIGGFSYSTHRLPASMVVRYLKDALDCEILIIGIQPKTIEFGERVSKEVEQAVRSFAKELTGLFKDVFKK